MIRPSALAAAGNAAKKFAPNPNRILPKKAPPAPPVPAEKEIPTSQSAADTTTQEMGVRSAGEPAAANADNESSGFSSGLALYRRESLAEESSSPAYPLTLTAAPAAAITRKRSSHSFQSNAPPHLVIREEENHDSGRHEEESPAIKAINSESIIIFRRKEVLVVNTKLFYFSLLFLSCYPLQIFQQRPAALQSTTSKRRATSSSSSGRRKGECLIPFGVMILPMICFFCRRDKEGLYAAEDLRHTELLDS